jgi:hypothetical protein
MADGGDDLRVSRIYRIENGERRLVWEDGFELTRSERRRVISQYVGTMMLTPSGGMFRMELDSPASALIALRYALGGEYETEGDGFDLPNLDVP